MKLPADDFVFPDWKKRAQRISTQFLRRVTSMPAVLRVWNAPDGQLTRRIKRAISGDGPVRLGLEADLEVIGAALGHSVEAVTLVQLHLAVGYTSLELTDVVGRSRTSTNDLMWHLLRDVGLVLVGDIKDATVSIPTASRAYFAAGLDDWMQVALDRFEERGVPLRLPGLLARRHIQNDPGS